MNLFDDDAQRFGEALGAKLWGGTLYELAPGEALPFHWHYGEEEYVIAVSGRPTLRTPEGERELEPWDVAVFARRAPGAHQLRNDGAEPARFVMFSTCSDPEVCVYPDDDRLAYFAGWSRGDVEERKGFVEPA